MLLVPSLGRARGPDAYAAVAEVVRILDADSTTDWSRVNLETLRQHLTDMNEVTLDSAARPTQIDGGGDLPQGAARPLLVNHRPATDRFANDPDPSFDHDEEPFGGGLHGLAGGVRQYDPPLHWSGT